MKADALIMQSRDMRDQRVNDKVAQHAINASETDCWLGM
jgi:hypothetical protein